MVLKGRSVERAENRCFRGNPYLASTSSQISQQALTSGIIIPILLLWHGLVFWYWCALSLFPEGPWDVTALTQKMLFLKIPHHTAKSHLSCQRQVTGLRNEAAISGGELLFMLSTLLLYRTNQLFVKAFKKLNCAKFLLHKLINKFQTVQCFGHARIFHCPGSLLRCVTFHFGTSRMQNSHSWNLPKRKDPPVHGSNGRDNLRRTQSREQNCHSVRMRIRDPESGTHRAET